MDFPERRDVSAKTKKREAGVGRDGVDGRHGWIKLG